ncbi:(Fe-S)-binding protein [Anaeroarcus burkinensis]|uniref:(Fe-S)-binding protein n=1 Tax=Anaeroarcus burkinensis TaxID=82376 RepID=UPI0003FA2804|nr:(Fe-S)-binding protein [Anaeroarcus burkinensis]
MTENKSFFSSWEAESDICGRCGNCRAECPTYRQTGWESATPRGKMTLLRRAALSQGGEERALLAKRISECTLCGSCTSQCAARIDLQQVWKQVRGELKKQGELPPAYDLLVKNLLDKKNISQFDNAARLDWAEELDEVPECLEAQEGSEVAYFVGCVSSFFPRAGQVPVAMVQLLERAGVSYTTLGGEEWCCGFPLLAAGAAEEMDAFARHNVEAVRELGVKTLITSCPSCYHTWTHEYPQRLGEELGFRVLHSTEYLLELVRQGQLVPEELEETVTYHDPCDLGRNSGQYAAPRELLQTIPGLELVEMASHGANAACCGGGGNLQSAAPQMAENIAKARVGEAMATGATYLVSACQQCEQMLEKAARVEKAPLQVLDVAEILWLAVDG